MPDGLSRDGWRWPPVVRSFWTRSVTCPCRCSLKLLTAIEKRHITRLGAVEPISIDVRLICATNANLRQLVGEGASGKTLLYRINTIEIAIPPLRERGEDILMLADHFQRLYSRKYKKTIKGLSREAGE